MNWLLIFLGGGLGSLARYGLGRYVSSFTTTVFPWATLAANVLSVVVMGLFLGYFSSRMPGESVRALVITGFCGGFSTFSTFSLETLELIRRGNYGFAAGNIVLSVTLCLLVLYVLIRK